MYLEIFFNSETGPSAAVLTIILHDQSMQLTCAIIESSNWARELMVISRSLGAIITHRADGCVVVKDNNAHGVIAEVPCRAGVAGRLSGLVLVGAIVATYSRTCAWWAIVAYWAAENIICKWYKISSFHSLSVKV